MKKSVVERFGTFYRDKQEALDYVDELAKTGIPIYGLEVVKLTKLRAESTMYKTIWFTSQENVYERARVFIKDQMVGVWNYVEFK
ncbi:MAG TPA: hypothetical protein VIK71_02620 [Flavobacteriales bacterium]